MFIAIALAFWATAGSQELQQQQQLLPPTVIADRLLSLDDALALASDHAPTLQSAAANVAAAKARALQGRAPLLPQLTAQLEYERTTSNYVLRPGSLPTNLTPQVQESKGKSYNFFVAQATLNQLVYDFGATTGNWRNTQALVSAQEQNALASATSVQFAVRSAFFAAWAAQAMVSVGEQTVDNMQKHLALATRSVEAGTQANIDLYTSKSNLAAAKLTAVNSEIQFANSKVALNQAIGIEGELHYSLVAPDPARALVVDDDEALIHEALAQRPELAQLRSQNTAQQAKVASLSGARLPSLSLQGTFSEQGQKIERLSYNWAAFAIVNWTAFSGGRATAALQEARAGLQALQASERQLRLSVRAAVQSAAFGIRAGVAARAAALAAAEAADQRLRLAEGRYRAGVGNIVELSDAQVAATSAAAQAVQADNQWWTAQAQLLLALGRRQ